MKIILLRHGKPLLPSFSKMTGSEFGVWINSYDAASLDDQHPATNESIVIADSCQAAICSTLIRSIESAKKLGLGNRVEVSSDFVEAGLPCDNFLNIKLSANVWLVLFRVLWLFGFSQNSETYKQVKLRVKKCSDKLEAMASQAESVMFVGHGILNSLISKELRRRGWQGPANIRKGYWQHSTYETESCTLT